MSNDYQKEVTELFNKLVVILKNSVNIKLVEKDSIKMPSFYNGEKFVRLIPFKKHINIEAKAIKNYLTELTDYTITPMGMLKIEIKQEIPEETLRKIFQETLLKDYQLSLEEQLYKNEYLNWNDADKMFIIEFNKQINNLGYTCNNEIVDGICYGKYMMIYRKQGVKSDKVYARFYFRNHGIVLRLFLSNIDKHADYINNTKSFIKETFIGDYAKCDYCRGTECKFRKVYSINNLQYEKCNGLTFEFYNLKEENVDDYIALFKEFYCK